MSPLPHPVSALGAGASPAFSETKSVLFDGVDDHLSVGDTSDFAGSNQSFSLVVWFKTSSAGATMDIISRYGATVAERDFTLQMTSSNQISIYLLTVAHGGKTATTTSTYNDGRWHLAIATYDYASTTLTIDIDGGTERVSNASVPTRRDVTVNVDIGRRSNTAALFWNGGLDEIAYYNDALSAAECIAIYNGGTPIDLNAYTATRQNLVSWWRMGDSQYDSTDSSLSYARIYDIMSLNNGTPVNMTAGDIVLDVPPSPASWSNAYSGWFDGGDDLLQGGATAFNWDSTDAWSVNVWCRTDTVGQHTFLVSKFDSAIGAHRGWGVGLYNNKPIMALVHDLGAGWQLERGGNSPYVPTGAWHMLTYTYDGSETIAGMKMYVDGVECGSYTNFGTNVQSPTTNTDRLLVASEVIAKGSVFFSGYLDELSIYNTALSAGTITTLYNLQTYVQGKAYDISGVAGIQGYWQMGDHASDSFANGGTIHDSVGSNNLTARNTVAGNKRTDNASEFTKLTSLDFDGVDDIAIAQNPPAYDYTSAFSISAWINTTGSNFGNIGGKQHNAPNYRGWGLFINPSSAGAFGVQMYNTLGSNQINLQTTNNGWNDGSWHHVVMTHDGTGTAAGINIYVDGVNQALTVNANSLSATILTSDGFSLGTRGTTSPSAYLEGKLDEVALYSTQLGASDVTAIYNGGVPNDLSSLASWTNIHTWWRLGEGQQDTAATIGEIAAGGTTTNKLECTNMADDDITTDVP